MKEDSTILAEEYGVDDESILDLAIEQGKHDLVKVLMDIGVPLEKRDSDGKTALRRAAEDNDATFINLLIKGGADKETLAEDGVTPLYAAAAGGHVDATRALIDGGANVDFAKSGNGLTPLVVSIASVKEETSALLIDAGADLTATLSGIPMLHLAASQKMLSTVRKLMDAGADVTATGAIGKTALVQTILKDSPSYLEIIEALIVKEALPSRDPNGDRNVLNLVLHFNMPSLVGKILEVGFAGPSGDHPFALDEPDADAYGGKAPLELAVLKRYYDQALLLLDHEFDVNVVSSNSGDLRFSPLIWAAKFAHDSSESRNLEVVQKLLAKGARLDQKAASGKTALMQVSGTRANSVNVLMAMINSLGPDQKSLLDIEDSDGKTAVRIYTNLAYINSQFLVKAYPLVAAGASLHGIPQEQQDYLFAHAVQDELYGVANNLNARYAAIDAVLPTFSVRATKESTLSNHATLTF